MQYGVLTLAIALGASGCGGGGGKSQDAPAPASPVAGPQGHCEVVFGYPLPDGGVGTTTTEKGNGFFCGGFAGDICPYGSGCGGVATVMVDYDCKVRSLADGMGKCVDTDEGLCGQGRPDCPFPFVCGAAGRCVPQCTCDWYSDAGAPEGFFCGGRYNPPICYPAQPPRETCSDTELCSLEVPSRYVCVAGTCRVRCASTEQCPSGSICEYIGTGSVTSACTLPLSDAGPRDAGSD